MNADTRICVSLAAHPGQFGVRFHNSAYRLFDLNFAYIPLRVRADDLAQAVRLVRDNVHGCSLSMPHKIRAMEFADALDDTASRTGAANTLRFDMSGSSIHHNYSIANDLVEAEDEYEEFLAQNRFDLHKVRLLTAMIFLNMAPLHHDPFDLLLYFKGKLMLFKALKDSVARPKTAAAVPSNLQSIAQSL